MSHKLDSNILFSGNQETPITTNAVEASDGVIQRKIKSGDRGNVQVYIPPSDGNTAIRYIALQ